MQLIFTKFDMLFSWFGIMVMFYVSPKNNKCDGKLAKVMFSKDKRHPTSSQSTIILILHFKTR